MLRRTGVRHVFSLFEKYRMAGDIAASQALTDEDVTRLAAESKRILADRICEVSESESRKFLLPGEPMDDSLVGRARWAVWGRGEGTQRLFRLSLERLENRRLQDTLGIAADFNSQLFWLFLHAWVLHGRMVAFDDGAQEEDYFEALFRVIDHWILAKDIPRHRLTLEIANAQKHALSFCIALDVACEKAEILPARIALAINSVFPSGHTELLTKYTLRQASLALHLSRAHFLQGQFLWADFPDRPPPLWRPAAKKPKSSSLFD
jgi:hypothetical protein